MAVCVSALEFYNTQPSEKDLKARNLFLKSVAHVLAPKVQKIIKEKQPACLFDQPSQWVHCIIPSGCLYWGCDDHQCKIIKDKFTHKSPRSSQAI